MEDNSTINLRVDKKLKAQCEHIFSELGLGMTAGITVFLKAVAREKGIPFDLSIGFSSETVVKFGKEEKRDNKQEVVENK